MFSKIVHLDLQKNYFSDKCSELVFSRKWEEMLYLEIG